MSDKLLFKEFVENCINKFNEVYKTISIIIMANRPLENADEYTINRTMDAVIAFCYKYNIDCIFFTKENELIEYLLKERNSKKHYFIYNRSINGPISARRMLIPAFCDFNNHKYLGNSSYLMGLLCNKAHYYSLLSNFGIPIAESYTYHYSYSWLTTAPPEGIKVIIKLNNENNAMSINKESVFLYSPEKEEFICELSKKNNQSVVVQKFIHGYEVTVPVFINNESVHIPEVVGSKINEAKRFGGNYINEELLQKRVLSPYSDKYYDFAILNESVCSAIKNDCRKIVKILGLKSFSRFDLRIDDSFSHFFNDLGSIPGILPNSSFSYVFQENGFSYEDFIIVTIVMDYFT